MKKIGINLRHKRTKFSIFILLVLLFMFSQNLYSLDLDVNNNYYFSKEDLGQRNIMIKTSSEYDTKHDNNSLYDYNFFIPMNKYTVMNATSNPSYQGPLSVFFIEPYNNQSNFSRDVTKTIGYRTNYGSYIQNSVTARLYYYYYSNGSVVQHGFVDTSSLSLKKIKYPKNNAIQTYLYRIKINTTVQQGDYLLIGYFLDNGGNFFTDFKNNYNQYDPYISIANVSFQQNAAVFFRFDDSINKVVNVNNDPNKTQLHDGYIRIHKDNVESQTNPVNYNFEITLNQNNLNNFFNYSDWIDILNIKVSSETQTPLDYVIGIKISSSNDFHLVSDNIYWGDRLGIRYDHVITNNSTIVNNNSILPINYNLGYSYLFGINHSGKTAKFWIKNTQALGFTPGYFVNDTYRDYITVEFITDVNNYYYQY